MNRRLVIGAAAAALVVVGAIWWFAGRSGSSAEVLREVAVRRGDIEVTIQSTGTVRPRNRLEIKPPLAGRAEQVLVLEGQFVRKGQVLAWMSSTERAALLDAARSKGPEELQRWEELYRATPIVSPITGTVILRNVEPGQTFTASDAVLVLSDRLMVEAQVDETDIAQVRVKQRAQIVLDAYPNEAVPAEVDAIAYEAKTVSNVTTYAVDVLPEKVPPFMRSGMTANVVFRIAAREKALLVPAYAVRSKDGGAYVLVRTAAGAAEERAVETGISDGKNVEVLKGVAESEQVLVARLKEAKPGGAVNPFAFHGQPRKK